MLAIRVARTMLPMPPYNTWPLHVKIFTEEAKKLWDQVQQPGLDTPLPRGFTYTIEYEGVDGKASVASGEKQGTRAGPIDVKDSTLSEFQPEFELTAEHIAKFILSHIDKYQALIDRGDKLACSLCSQDLAGKRIVRIRISYETFN